MPRPLASGSHWSTITARNDGKHAESDGARSGETQGAPPNARQFEVNGEVHTGTCTPLIKTARFLVNYGLRPKSAHNASFASLLAELIQKEKEITSRIAVRSAGTTAGDWLAF